MRGTPDVQAILCGQGGIIPADAGNTIAKESAMKSPGDHPRGCGEHMSMDLL